MADLEPTTDLQAAQPLSKNAQKRLAKAARRAEQKLERRAHEKALKKEKKRARAVDPETGETLLRPPKKLRVASTPFDACIVIDLGFDKLMTAKECASLCSQLGYTYSSQRRSTTPFSSLAFSSLGGQTQTHLETVGQGAYKRWKRIEWWDDGYEKLWSSPGLGLAQQDEAEAKSRVVYLTADSDTEISELLPGYTYVIGGIVDHNRYKNLCLDKANKQGIQTAKLPIGTYLAVTETQDCVWLEMKSRKVLTINQCYDVLLRWAETKDWEDSIKYVMPKRKLKEGQSAEGGDVDKSNGKTEVDVKSVEISAEDADEEDEQEVAASV